MAAKLQFDVSALDKASATFIKMAGQVERLAAKIDKLDGKKADVEIGVDTSGADREVGRFATDVRTKLSAALKSLPELKLTADSSDAQRDIERIRNEMLALRDQRIGVDIDSGAAVAQVSRLRAELEAVAKNSADIQVRADAGAAIAQLSAVEAAVQALDGQSAVVDVDVDSMPVEAATEALSNMVGMTEAVAAAWPPVSAGILAIPGALALVAAPLATVVVGMNGIKQSAVGLIPPFMQLQTVVGAAFTSGLAPAVSNLQAMFPALQSGMVGTASALSEIATRVSSVVASSSGLQQVSSIFEGVNRIVTTLAPALATMTSNFLKLGTAGLQGLSGLGPMLDQVGQAWQRVIDAMIASGTVQGAVAGLVQVLGGVLNLLPPLVQAGSQLMAVLGPPLAAILNALASVLGTLSGPLGNVTTTVLALTAAWKIAAVTANLVATATSKVVGASAEVAAAQGTAAASSVAAAAAAAANAATLEAQAVAATQAAAAAEANATTLAQAAVAAEAHAVALRAAAVSETQLAAAAEAGAAATAAQTAASEAAAAALSAQARAAQAAAVSTAASAQATAATGAAAGGAAAGAGKATAAFTKMGTGIGALMVALVGLTVISSKAQEKQDALTQAFMDGSAQLQQLKDDNDSFKTWWGGMWSDSSDDVVQNAQKMYDAMSPVQQAQVDLTRAQTAYNDAVKSGNPDAVAAAQRNLAVATQAVAKAQSDASIAAANVGVSMAAAAAHFQGNTAATDAAARSAKTLADAYATLIDPMASISDKAAGFSSVFAQTVEPAVASAEATRAVNDSMRGLDEALTPVSAKLVSLNGTINTTTEAGSQLQQQVLAVGPAMWNSYGTSIAAATANGVSLTQATADAAAAFAKQKQAVVDLMVQQGVARPAAQALADTYIQFPKDISTKFTQPGMVEAIVGAMGLKDSIIGVPDTKSVIIKAPTDAVIKQLQDLGLEIVRIPGTKDVIVKVAGDTSGFTGTVNSSKVDASTPVTTPLNGDASQLNSTINSSQVDASTPQTMPLAADAASANSTINSSQADASTPQTMPFAANATSANSTINSSQADASTPQTMPVNANTSAANSAIDYAARDRTATIYVSTVNSTVNSSVAGGAIGGVVKPMRDGGVVGMAAGALNMRLRPMAGGVAQVVPPNTWRVIGDRVTDDEAFIPINASARSQTILNQTAQRMGYDLMPTGRAASSWTPPLPAARGGGGIDFGALTAGIRGLRDEVGDMRADLAANTSAGVATARNTGGLLAEAQRSRPNSGDHAAGARTQAALGMFG
jgi:hypothetical protein